MSYNKIQRDALSRLSFEHYCPEYMCVPVDGSSRTEVMCCSGRVPGIDIISDSEYWYAVPARVSECGITYPPSNVLPDTFVNSVFGCMRGVEKVYSGATQNIFNRLRSHQAEFLSHERWTKCYVTYYTSDVKDARFMETIQNHIVFHTAQLSGGRIRMPNECRSMMSRGLRTRPCGEHTLYMLYVLTR
jgi:hypothetical protein